MPVLALATRPEPALRELTLADTLLRARLLHREARLQLVLAALADRVRDNEHRAFPVPEALKAAIRGFESELSAVRDRLVELGSAARAT